MTLRIDDAFPSKYIRAADLENRTHRLTIENITIETLTSNGKDEEKPAVWFKGRKKGWVLNKTNALELAGRYGNDMEKWFGLDVELFAMKVQGPQGLTDGIRCRVPATATADHERDAPAATESTGPGHDFDDDIPF